MKRFELNLKQSIRTLYIAFVFMLMGIIGTLFFIIKDGFQYTDLLFFVFITVPYSIPTIIIWIQYVRNDAGKILSLRNDAYDYEDLKSNIQYSFLKSDISEIRIIKRNVPGDLGIHSFPWSYFFYTEIQLKNHKHIRLSFLSLPDYNIFGVPITVINKPLPYIG